MAQRDKSQGFGFVYVDVKKLLAEKKEAPSFSTPDTKVLNFNKDPEKTVEMPAPENQTAIRQIRENLDRLQSLHHKLHAMLDELDQLTGREKKRRS